MFLRHRDITAQAVFEKDYTSENSSKERSNKKRIQYNDL